MNKVKLTENRKKLYLSVVTAALVIIAFLGYALEQKKEPVRVAFVTRGGGVIFDHKLHASLKNTKCQECHHNHNPGAKEPPPGEMKCRDCHYSKEFKEACEDENIHKRCIGKNCTGCHLPGTVECDFCHNEKNFKIIPPPQKVQFDTDGGQVGFDHFTHASADGYGIECETCHHGYKAGDNKSFPMKCRRCHYNKKYENLCEKEDTHIRCIGKNCLDCHADGSNECTICHKE